MNRKLHDSTFCLATMLALNFAGTVQAQSSSSIDEIIVTARRVEESLQDVPISITVFNAQQLSNRNIQVATDLATYTPSLSVNQRYGPEKASFAIRGFNQDQSTAPTVGVYFADVVGVRAQGGTTSGNTVGAGAFTDLQNVQVLKGPQGTLFGRNTTGGAVLLVPKKPTNEFGGYIEGTVGNYDARHIQGALNVPVADWLRVRLSVDSNQRDGYMKNHSGIGAGDYSDLNYIYGRLSIVADLTANLENYLIVHYSDSDTNGYTSRISACNTNPAIIPVAPSTLYATSQAACNQIARQAARGDGKLDVDVDSPDPFQKLKTWQAINTTTWHVSDNLTLKNIASYGEFTEHASFNLNGDNFFVPNTAITQGATFRGAGWQPGQPFQYIWLDTSPGEDNAGESTWTEELQLQGNALDSRLNWVTGAYFEYSRPLGWSAGRTSIYANCSDAENIVCTEPLGFGLISASRTQLKFDNTGYFAQGTYKFTEKFALTLGARYTSDKIEGESEGYRYTLSAGPNPQVLACNDSRVSPNPTSISQCHVERQTKSEKPTWLVDFDYKPVDGLLLYAKWSRGYRQGGVNFTNVGLETWQPESVNAFEMGAKTALPGGLPGYFNVAAFYNNFTNQQIFASGIPKPGSNIAGGAPIVNAGKSEIYGLEVDTSVSPLEHLRFDLNYTYLKTKLKELVAPTLAANSPFLAVLPNGTVGSALTESPNNKASLTGTYTLPLDEAIGSVSLGATYVYTDKLILSSNSPFGIAPPTQILNVNLNWDHAMGSPLDVAAFVTNVTDKIYPVAVGQSFTSAGFESVLYAPPRMYGFRLRYSFGGR